LIRKSAALAIEDALEFEIELAATLIASEECYHGIAAFLSKKEPDFPDI